ncbi:XrtA/PEP-CTERM system TPR-repeat protein PrsT [Vibrio sp. HN007]|uniref:XrtA/PEP-CTERM system TPR-repeat protein PrsT n=1 Tax=Vibrio iocasae TaxID=3098914 RepID=UPI0035D4AF34
MSYKLRKSIQRCMLLAVTSSVFVCGSAYSNKYITNAQEYLNENNINAAIIELKNAIQSSPKDAQPRLMLGIVYLEQGNFVSASKEFERALSLEGNRDEVLPLLVRSKLNQGLSQQAIDLIDISKISSPYAKAELLSLKSIAQLNLGKIQDAEHSLQLAKDTSYDTLYTQLGRAKIDASKNHIDSALRTVNEILTSEKNNSDVWLFKGHLEAAKKEYEQAVSSYKKAYELAPNALHYTLFIARTLVLSRKYSEAEPHIDNILSIAPNNVLGNELKAVIEYENQDFNQAKEHSERAIHNGASQISTYVIAGVSAYQLGLLEQSKQRFEQISDKLPHDHYVNKLYIATLLKLGYVESALQLLEDYAVESEQDGQYLSSVSAQLSELGRTEEALKLAQKAAETGNAGSEVMLGLIKLSGDDKSGLNDIKAALDEKTNSRKAELTLAFYSIKLKDYDEAYKVAEKWLKINSEDTLAIQVKGLVNQAKQNYTLAESAFRKVVQLEPNNIKARTSLAQVMASQKKWQDSYKHAYEAKKQMPNDEAAYTVLLVAASQTKRLSDLIELLNSQIEANNDIALIHQKARALAVDKKEQQAVELLESIAESNKTPRTWKLIGDIYFQQTKWVDAEKAYTKLVDKDPIDVNGHIRLVHISEMTHKLRKGVSRANKAEEIFPNDVRFPLMKAGLLYKLRDFDSSQAVLDSLDNSVKQSLYALKLQGRLFIAHKDYSSAVPVYELMFEKNPDVKSADQLSSVLYLNGQGPEALAFLEKLIEQYPSTAKPLNIKVADLLSKMAPEKAIAKYQAILEKEPNNLIALNNIAALYQQKDQFSNAQVYADKAYEIAPANPAISDTYAYNLLNTGDIKKAMEILEKAHDKVPSHAEIALHFAQSLIANNLKNKAASVLLDINTDEPRLLVLKKELEDKLN